MAGVVGGVGRFALPAFAGAAVASSAHAETSNLKKADSSLAPFMGQGNKDRSVVFDRKTTNTPYNNFDNLPSNRQSNSRAMFDVLNAKQYKNAVQNITNDQKFNINMNINMLPGDLKGLGDHVRRELSSVSPYAIQSKRATD